MVGIGVTKIKPWPVDKLNALTIRERLHDATPADLAVLLDKVERAQEVCKLVLDQLKPKVEKGEIPGWKTEHTRTVTQWIKDEAAIERALGVDAFEITRKLRSITVMRKLLGKKEFEALAEDVTQQVDQGSALVRTPAFPAIADRTRKPNSE